MINKKIIAFLLLLSLPVHGFIRGRSFFLPRSQSEQAGRNLVGWQDTINLWSDGSCYESLSISMNYLRSFKAEQIAEYFFGCDSFGVAGSRAERTPCDLLGDYFGLPTDYVSRITFRPVVQDGIFQVNFFSGLDALYPGVYFCMYVPLVYSRWDMNFEECVSDLGVSHYPAGYMAHEELEREQLSQTAKQWFAGGKVIGDLQPLQYGKIHGGKKVIGIADIPMSFGWNPVMSDAYHFGFNLRTVIPTGNKSKSRYLFEPIIGNGRHWEIGLGLNGHTLAWESHNGEHTSAVYGELILTHLFSSTHKRSFDFKKNGPSSRYILIEEIGNPIIEGLILGDNDDPALQQYHGKILPAINQTTLDVDISIALQANFVFQFSYYYKNIGIDIGYDLWGRTAENPNCRQPFQENCFAIKGDAQVYGFTDTTNTYIGLNATQSNATIFAGQSVLVDDQIVVGNASHNFANVNADNAAEAKFMFPECCDDTIEDLFQIPSTEMEPFARTEVNGSNQAILLTDCDIDNLSGLAPAAIQQSLYFHVDYQWFDTERVEPSLGVGGILSMDGTTKKRRSALWQWGLWIKGTIAY